MKNRKNESLCIANIDLLSFNYVNELPLSLLLHELALCRDLQEQIAAIQNRKASIQASLVSSNGNLCQDSVALLVHIYLDPKLESIKQQFDSMIDILLRYRNLCNSTETNNQQLESFRKGFLKAFSSYECTSVTKMYDINHFILAAKLLHSTASLDKEIIFLQLEILTSDERSASAPTLYSYLKSIKSYLDLLLPDSLDLQCTSDLKSLNIPQIQRVIDICGEFFKPLVVTLKSRKKIKYDDVTLSIESQDKWSNLASSISTYAWLIINSTMTSKDVMTSSAMAIVCCIHFILNIKSVTPSQQGIYIAQLLLKSTSYDATTKTGSSRQNYFLQLQQYKWSNELSKIPILVQCALVRAILSVFHHECLIVTATPGFNTDSTTADVQLILLTTLYTTIYTCCVDSLPGTKQYGLQTFESWLNHVDSLLESKEPKRCTSDKLFTLLQDMSDIIIQSLTHPLKIVTQIATTLHEKLLDTVLNLFKYRRGDTSRSRFWSRYVNQALSLPVHHRARYNAISMLLPRVGPQVFLENQPEIISTLIKAVKLRDICSACSKLIGTFLNQLFSESEPLKNSLIALEFSTVSTHQNQIYIDKSALRNLWSNQLITELLSAEERSRINSADYLLPEFLIFDAASGPFLISLVKARKAAVVLEHYLWALLSIGLHTRLLSLPGRDFIDTPSGLSPQSSASSFVTLDEVALACLSEKFELRLLGLTALTACQKTTMPFPVEDLNTFKTGFIFSFKPCSSEHRQSVIRIMKLLVARLYENFRVNTRDKHKMDQRITALNRDRVEVANSMTRVGVEIGNSTVAVNAKLEEIDRKLLESEEMILQCNSQIASFESTCEWLSRLVYDNLYPGSTSDREIMSLEILHTLIDFSSIQQQKFHTKYFCSVPSTKAVIHLIFSTWDRTRTMSRDLLLKFPHPLPGYSSSKSVQKLLRLALALSGSSRQRESESGASLLRIIFDIYFLDLHWDISTVCNEDILSESFVCQNNLTKSASCQKYLLHIMGVLELRLRNLEFFFNSLGDVQNYLQDLTLVSENKGDSSCNNNDSSDRMNSYLLSHGLIMGVRYCIESSATEQLITSTESDSSWKDLIHKIMDVSTRGLITAMQVIAEAKSDEPFSVSNAMNCCKIEVDVDAKVASSKGPINTSTIVNNFNMAASYVNTNSLVTSAGSLDPDNDDGMYNSKSNNGQRAVVAAWLLAKESCSLLSCLVKVSCNTIIFNRRVASKHKPFRQCYGHDALPINTNSDSLANSSYHSLLSYEDVSNIGSLILDALGRLKHMGAISEAQVALQIICESILRSVDENTTSVCQLPSIWMGQVLARLDSAQQVFILRRSAGYAYSFLSILRAEFAKPKQLLPIAVNALLRHVRIGFSATVESQSQRQLQSESEQDFVLDKEHWRMAVHALNVIRLILLDAIVGVDLDPFLAEIAELSIQGFKSSQWAIRNSSMMMFASMIQRTADNEKHDSGGSKATSIVDFFHRFPRLFPFLVRELSSITRIGIKWLNDYPVSLDMGSRNNCESATNNVSNDCSERNNEQASLQPTLFPILLLISKLRSPDSMASVGANDLKVPTNSLSVEAANISLFVPLVMSCCSQRVQKVRNIAAKALNSLTPLENTNQRVTEILIELNALFDANAASSQTRFHGLSSNVIHGQLLFVYELIDGFRRHSHRLCDQDTISMQAINICISVAQHIRLLAKNIRKYFNYCPPIQLVFLKAVKCLTTFECLSSSGQSNQSVYTTLNLLLLEETWYFTSSLFSPQLWQTQIQRNVPYQQLMWKEALNFFACIMYSCDGENINAEMTKPNTLKSFATSISEILSIESTGVSICSASLDGFKSNILRLFKHPSSEVREGVLLALSDLATKLELERSLEITPIASLLEQLLQLVMREKEPQITSLAFEVLVRFIRISKNVQVPVSIQAVFISSWKELYDVTTKDILCEEESLINTTTPSHAIEVLGWIVRMELLDIRRYRSGYAVESTEFLRLRSHIQSWLILVETSSTENNRIDDRLSTARSIYASEAVVILLYACFQQIGVDYVLNISSSTPASIEEREIYFLLSPYLLRLWLVVMTLLDDDDEDVRAQSNQIMTAIFCNNFFNCVTKELNMKFRQTINDGRSIFNHWGTESEFARVEMFSFESLTVYIGSTLYWLSSNEFPSTIESTFQVALEKAFLMIMTRFKMGLGDCVAIESLLQTPCDENNLYESMYNPSLTSKIFDAEQLNLYSEPIIHTITLVDAVELAVTMFKSKKRVSDVEDSNFLIALFQALLEHGIQGLKLATSIQIRTDVEDIVYQKDIYAYLKGTLHILTRWNDKNIAAIFDGKVKLARTAQDISRILRDVNGIIVLHPLLYIFRSDSL